MRTKKISKELECLKHFALSPKTFKRFRLFLIENNAYSKYIYNVMHDKEYRAIYGCNEHIRPKGAICDTFSWARTIEGRDFWNDLNNKWETILTDNNF